MIEVLNEEINKFLSSHPSVEKNTLSQIKKRYSSTVTDELSKGHLTTNVCMIAASQLKINPKELANELQKELSDSKKFKKVEAAGPGFINITLKRENFISTIDNVNTQSINFGSSNSGKNQSIQIEFVSANPTGPLHVGHGRGAAYGDAIGRILKSSGYEVQKEYYINDAGRQIDILTASVFTRIFKEDLSGYFPKNAYKGSYIFDIAELFKKKYRPNTLIGYKSLIHNLPQEEEKEIDELILRIKKTENDMWSKVKSLALSEVLQTIRADLESFNVSFDNWFSESSLGDLSDKKSKISTAITSLKNKDLAYEENGAIWLNTSHTGDDKNRG